MLSSAISVVLLIRYLTGTAVIRKGLGKPAPDVSGIFA